MQLPSHGSLRGKTSTLNVCTDHALCLVISRSGILQGEFHTREFWDKFYATRDGEPFEWYGTWADISAW
jgi:hypothetical protein